MSHVKTIAIKNPLTECLESFLLFDVRARLKCLFFKVFTEYPITIKHIKKQMTLKKKVTKFDLALLSWYMEL